MKVSLARGMGVRRLRVGFSCFVFFDGVAGFAAKAAFFQADEVLVQRVAEVQEADVGLQGQTDLGGVFVFAEKIVNRERGEGAAVEGLDLGPFESNHVLGEMKAGAYQVWMFVDEGGQMPAEVAHCERTRWMSGQIFLGEFIEFQSAEDRTQAGEIIVKRIDQAKPILAVVDFDAFEAGEAVVGFDEFGGDLAHVAVVGPFSLHAPLMRKRAHDDRAGEALQFFVVR